jgi:cysteine synthase/rhodanese-related sulfurtransferase
VNDDALRVHDSVVGLLSNVDNPTPLVRLNRVVRFEHTEVYAKLEWYNPFGAIKDRVAANMIRDAEEQGVIGPNQRLVEPTSGNTGLGLAMLANTRGYALTATMSDQIPLEKRTMLRFFGANVVELQDDLCPAPWAPEGAIARAAEIAAAPEFHMLDQYSNEANPEAHYRTTGPEIWRQTKGTVTHFVASLGTCGTITGTGRYLKEQNPRVQVIGVHPGEGHDIPGVRSLRQLEQTRFFLPDEYDGLVEIDDRSAYELCLRLNQEESIIAGPSSGLAVAGVLAAVPDEPGNRVVVVFPDSVFKYASSMIRHFEGLGAASETRSGRDPLMASMIENARVNPALAIDTVSAHEVWKEQDALVIDVRNAAQFAAGHIAGAINIPLDELPNRADELPGDHDAPILAVCGRGNISLPAVLFLNSLGYENAKSISGGTTEWAAFGYATETG